eukprot:NODE_90_length_21806_cov_0.389137.p5 type:complete len:213 gc:universal NODE_90_length_21806_cov_0.389137:5189-5827(+)
MEDYFENEILDVQQELVFQLAGFGHKTRQVQKKIAEVNTDIRNTYNRIKSKRPTDEIKLEDENDEIGSCIAKYLNILSMQDDQITAIKDLKSLIEKNVEKTGTLEDDNYDSVYCYCGRTSSNMICCESNDCSIKWYHFECAGVSDEETRPDKKWICHRCLYDDLCNNYKSEIEAQQSNLKNTNNNYLDDLDDQIIPLKRKIIDSEVEDTISK